MAKVNRKSTPKTATALRARSTYEIFEERRLRRERTTITLLLMAAWFAIVLAWTVTR